MFFFYFQTQPLIVKNVPLSTKDIRFDNIRGGSNPVCMFVGLIPQQNLAGDPSDSSTHFRRHGVSEMNITLNGNSVNGYPLTCKYGSPIIPFQKFIQTTGRHYNINAGETVTCDQFKTGWVWSHKFEAETSNQGWIGINFNLEKEFTQNMVMVVWIVSNHSVSIDKFHQLEKNKV